MVDDEKEKAHTEFVNMLPGFLSIANAQKHLYEL